MINKKSINALFILASAGLISSSAFGAVDVYPGAMCTKTGTNGTYSLFYGTVANASSTQELTVVCPFPKDQEAPHLKPTPAPPGGFITTSEAVVFDRNTTRDVSCTLTAAWISGANVYEESEARTTSNAENASRTLSFSNWIGDQSGGAAYLYATCTIPRTDAGKVSHLGTWKLHTQAN